MDESQQVKEEKVQGQEEAQTTAPQPANVAETAKAAPETAAQQTEAAAAPQPSATAPAGQVPELPEKSDAEKAAESESQVTGQENKEQTAEEANQTGSQ